MSIAVRKQLAAELTRLREAKNLTQAAVASHKIAVVETIRAIEKAERPIKPSYVKLLCALYEADQQTLDRLLGMAANREKGWWEGYKDVMDPKFRFFVQAENAATEVCTYDSELLYGLLQTPEYHEVVYHADPSLPPEKFDRESTMRGERLKATLGRTPPLRIRTVINAGILGRRWPGANELRAHLRALALQAHIKLSVLPSDAGPHAAMRGSFKILSFDLPDVPDVAYEEHASGVRYSEETATVALYRAKFQSVSQQAVPLEEYLS